MSQRKTRRFNAASPAPLHHEETEDVKAGTATDRRVLRLHYKRLKNSIAECKEQLLSVHLNNFDEVCGRVDDLYALVHRPREQIADAEALLDITEAFLKSVKDSLHGGGLKAADLVSMILQNFRQRAHLDDNEAVLLDWAVIGYEANAIFCDAPGIDTMLDPMDSEPKRRKVKTARRRERGPVAETARPETVGNGGGENQPQTDKNIQTMFNVLRRCGDVKDGRAQISIENGKQLVAFKYAPTAAERSGGPEGGAQHHQVANTQFVFRFDFKDWTFMKDMVEVGKELMPRRSQEVEPSQNPSMPIRMDSRNRGRVTSSEQGASAIHADNGEESEEQDGEENDLSNCSRHPTKKRRL